MFTNPYNPYETDVLAELSYKVAVIITLIITIIVLVKFFRMCRDVASIAELLKEQREMLASSTQAKDSTSEIPPASQTEPISGGYSWIIWLLIVAVVIIGLFAILLN